MSKNRPMPFTGTADDLTQADTMILRMMAGAAFTGTAVLIPPSGRSLTPAQIAELRPEIQERD